MSAPSAILLLEDDPAIGRTVAYALERDGAYRVTQVLLVREALAAIRRAPPACVILDLGLPDGDGLDLLRTLRSDARTAQLPLLVLSARGEEIDRVLGLEFGADDYLAKPFSPRELVARVRALLRRAPRGEAAPPQRFELDAAGQRVRYAGAWLDLTRLEFGLLQALLAAPARIHRREALLAAVWGHDSDTGERSVDTHLKTLRAKLRAQQPEHDPIVTHRGLGWSLRL